MIKVHFYSSPVTEVFKQGFIALPMRNVVPAKIVTCANLAEVQAARDAFVEEVRATGKPAVVAFFKAHRQDPGARKPAGFDALGRKQTLLNTESVQRKEEAA